MKAAMSTDHSRSPRNDDRVAVIFRVVVGIIYILLTSWTTSVVSTQSGIIVGVIFTDGYGIMKRANWGLGNQRVRIKRRIGGRVGRWIGEGREDKSDGTIGGDKPILWWWKWFLSCRKWMTGCRIVLSLLKQASSKAASVNLWIRLSSFNSCLLGQLRTT